MSKVPSSLVVAFFFRLADAGADGCDHRLNLRVLKRLIEARFLHVDQLASDRKDRLVTAIAALLGGAAGGITFDNIKLGQLRVALGTVGQLARQTTAGKRAFANRLAGFAGRLAGTGRSQHFIEDPFRHRRILIEIVHQPVVDHRVNDAVDLSVNELHLGLRFEARVRQFDAEDADESFAHVVAGNGRVLLLHETVCLGVLVDRLRQGSAKSGQVRATVRIRNRIGEGQNLVVIAVVVLQNDIDKHFVTLPRDHDRFGMDNVLVFTQLLHELLNSMLVEEGFSFSSAPSVRPAG